MRNETAHALTYAALIALKTALEQAEDPADFLAEVDAIVDDPANRLSLPFDAGTPEPLDAGPRRMTGRDRDNAPLVYDYLGALDRSNAADRRLWTYLALRTYRPYMEQRWPLSPQINWKGRVETRWLMLNASRGSLVRHGISRLWWVANLTHDPTCRYPLSQSADDPFAYARAVLQSEDRVNALFDREAGAIPNLVRTVLEHVSEEAGREPDGYLRALMKGITLVHGYRDLATLDTYSLTRLVESTAPRITSRT